MKQFEKSVVIEVYSERKDGMRIEEWLGQGNQLGIDIWQNKYRFNGESFDEWLDRVSNNNEELKDLIVKKKFLFGGRTLTNYNTNKNASTSNCYSSGYSPDSVEGIMDLAKKMALTYKAQGGQGVSLSKIRPKGSKISAGYESDGIIPFMEIFNTTTSSISQGGSRKGALMMSIDAWHKEAETFITIKSEQGKIEKANLSLEIDNEFMSCIKDFYKKGKIKTVKRVFEYETGKIEYEVTPINLYKKLCQISYDWAEPGVIYTDKFRNYNIMQFDKEYEVVTGNPCGEQPLPKHGACNLGSINLSEFVTHPYTQNATFDMQDFIEAVTIAIQALDDVLDYGLQYHVLQEQKDMARNYRNIGLGIMGLGSALVKLGIKYGSSECISLLDLIMNNMFKFAVTASSKIAKVKGSFPKYSEVVWESDIIKQHFTQEEISQLKQDGLRNCSLLSIAPSGSIGTMLNISTGCEPFFRISYKRKTVSLHKEEEVYYDVLVKELQEFQEVNHTKDIPDYFVSSESIDWRDRVLLQGILQLHVDTAISSTVNLPSEIKIEDIEQLYLLAWEYELKGITIFRDGCKRFGILVTDDKNNEKENKEVQKELPRGVVINVDDNVIGKKRKLMTGCGTLHCQAFFDPINGELQETYFSKGSSGGCVNSYVGLSRMISLSARSGVDIYSIVDQLKSSGVCPSYATRSATKHDTSKGSSCPVAIGNALLDMYNEIQSEINADVDYIKPIQNRVKQSTQEHESKAKPLCPECGEALQFEGGCQSCNCCGYSKCE